MDEKPGSIGSEWEEIFRHLFFRQDKPFTTFEVSKICGVVHSTISKWVDEGRIKGFRTLGRHRRIQKEDLLHFLKAHHIPIPADLTEVRKRLAGSPEPIAASRKRVLLVMSDRLTAGAHSNALKKQFPKYDFLQAFDGFQAGKLIARFSPHLIVLDLHLPDVDGFRVLQNIRQDPITSGTKIIAVTAGGSTDAAQKCEQCGGVEGFLLKPFKAEAVIEKVERLLGESVLNQ